MQPPAAAAGAVLCQAKKSLPPGSCTSTAVRSPAWSPPNRQKALASGGLKAARRQGDWLETPGESWAFSEQKSLPAEDVRHPPWSQPEETSVSWPGIKAGSTAWKAAVLTNIPAMHLWAVLPPAPPDQSLASLLLFHFTDWPASSLQPPSPPTLPQATPHAQPLNCNHLPPLLCMQSDTARCTTSTLPP